MSPPGTPKVDKLKARRDSHGLIAMLQQETDGQIRQDAAAALGALGSSDATEPLIAALYDSAASVRAAAARALGQIGDTRATRPILMALGDRDIAVQKAAAWALGQVGNTEAIAPLIALLKQWDDADCDTVSAALVQIGMRLQGAMLQATLVEPLLTAFFKEQTVSQCTSALHILEQIGWQPDRSAVAAIYWLMKGEWDACVRIGKPAIPPLVDALCNPDLHMRQIAFWALVRIGAPAIPPLIGMLNDADPDVHQAAFWTLAKIGRPTVEPLVLALQQEPCPYPLLILELLGEIGDAQATGPLLAMLGATHEQHRTAAVAALVKIGKPAIPALTAALTNPDITTRTHAAAALEQIGWHPDHSATAAAYWIVKQRWNRCIEIGEPALEPLMLALHHPEKQVRKATVRTLIKIGRISVVPLIAALKDDIAEVRESAAIALGQLRDRRAVAPLSTLLHDHHASVRKAAIVALVRSNPPEEVFIGALGSSDPVVRRAAVRTLGRIGDTRAVEPLIALVRDRYEEVREMVADALGMIGDDRAIQPVISMLNDPSEHVREAAAEAMYRLYQLHGTRDP
jgi:HEAT repeat protein